MPARAPARIVVLDDHPTVRAGTQLLLEQAGFLVADATETVAQTQVAVRKHRPQVLVADLDLHAEHTPPAFPALLREVPGMRILVLTVHDELSYVREALAAGAHGYVLKDAPGAELAHAVAQVIAGSLYLTASIAARMARRSPDDLPLSAREEQLLPLLAAGHSNTAIAHQMQVSVRTVESIRAGLRQRLGLTDRAALVAYAAKHAR